MKKKFRSCNRPNPVSKNKTKTLKQVSCWAVCRINLSHEGALPIDINHPGLELLEKLPPKPRFQKKVENHPPVPLAPLAIGVTQKNQPGPGCLVI